MPKVPAAVQIFAPEMWGEVDYFKEFYETTYEFNSVQKRAVSGVKAHFQKAIYLLNLSKKLAPNLELDLAELEEHGFSAVHNSAELATVVEATILELYSVIDCTAKVIHAIHAKSTPRFKNSTRSLFQNIEGIHGTIPEEIRSAIKNAKWYWRLLYLRDELTHLTPGSCSMDSNTKIISYMHTGIKEGERPLIIDNIFAWIDETMIFVNTFIGSVFHYLRQGFKDKAVFQMCGMVEGRLLHRWLRPPKIGERFTFHSGECGAWVWFEKPEFPTCPFVDVCGAYQRKAAPQGWET